MSSMVMSMARSGMGEERLDAASVPSKRSALHGTVLNGTDLTLVAVCCAHRRFGDRIQPDEAPYCCPNHAWCDSVLGNDHVDRSERFYELKATTAQWSSGVVDLNGAAEGNVSSDSSGSGGRCPQVFDYSRDVLSPAERVTSLSSHAGAGWCTSARGRYAQEPHKINATVLMVPV